MIYLLECGTGKELKGKNAQKTQIILVDDIGCGIRRSHRPSLSLLTA